MVIYYWVCLLQAIDQFPFYDRFSQGNFAGGAYLKVNSEVGNLIDWVSAFRIRCQLLANRNMYLV